MPVTATVPGSGRSQGSLPTPMSPTGNGNASSEGV